MFKKCSGEHDCRVSAKGSLHPDNSFVGDSEQIHFRRFIIVQYISAQHLNINWLENKDLVVDEFLHRTS